MIMFAVFAAAFLLTYVGVGLFRQWSLEKGLMDVPNERSSHIVPTPRGGGIVIALVCIFSYGAISFYYPETFSWGYLLGALIVIIVSWLDDVYSIWFGWRLLVHSAAAVILILDGGVEKFGLGGVVVIFFGIVWFVNAYNFMDGIDGLAGLQTVVAAASWMLLANMIEIPVVFYFSGVIAFASLGFLIHNWQPSKIFMGDVGSAFLGFTFAAIPVLAARMSAKTINLFPLVAILFLWFFLFDSLVTRIRRLLSGENVFSSHREHIYQVLVISGYSHGYVAFIYGTLAVILSISTLLSIKLYGYLALTVFIIAIILTFLLLLIYLSARKKNRH